MVETWIWITLLATVFQTARTGIQKHLKGRLGTDAVNFVRYGFGVPFALAYLALILTVRDAPLPEPNLTFVLAAAAGGAGQIAATAFLIILFGFRNFAVGTTYSKTEVIQTAIIGVVLFGETLTLGAFIGILLSLIGVLLISLTRDTVSFHGLATGWMNKAALMGVASGAGFALAALCIRQATQELPPGDFMVRAAYTLVWVTGMQTVAMAIWITLRRRREWARMVAAWRPCLAVGALSVAGSASWFTAFTLQTAAYVRAVGQFELVLSLLFSVLVFRERVRKWELVGIVVVVAGILMLVWRG